MRDILIVGAGQAGLQLALGLRSQGYHVTVVAERTPEEMRAGRVTSTQVMFPRALAAERAQGLALWDAEVPRMPRTGFTVPGSDGSAAVDWLGEMGGSESVDQRLKMPAWLELFAERGGDVLVRRLTVDRLDAWAARFDLVVVAAGRGELAGLFERDAARSPFGRPQRHLAASYVHGARPRPGDAGPAVHLNVVPGVGELYFMPGLTLSGPCEIVLVEAVPGQPFDVFGVNGGADGGRWDVGRQWGRIRELIAAYTPWDEERTRTAEPTDTHSSLTGAITPAVRRPVAELPSGTPVLGLGDTVVTNDPIAGQGANNASWAATVCLHRILAHGDLPFDRAWMRDVFERIWEGRTGASVSFSNTLLRPPPEHVLELLAAGNTRPAVADRIARAIDRVEDFENFLYEPAQAHAYLASLGADDG